MISSRFTRSRGPALAGALGIAALAWPAAAAAQPDEALPGATADPDSLQRVAIQHYRVGRDLLVDKRDFRNAAIELEAAAAIDSTYDVALFALSRAHGFLGNYIRAADALRAALRHGLQKPPDRAARSYVDSLRKALQPEAFNPLSNYRGMMGRMHHRSWIDSLRASRYQSYAVGLADFYYRGGLVSRQQRRFGEAIDHLELSLRNRPSDAWLDSLDAAFAGPLRLLREGEARPAWIDSLETARQLGVRHRRHRAQTFYTIALCHLSLRQPDQAVPALRQAIDVYPTYPWPYVSLGHLHRQRGELRQAAQMYEKAIAMDGTIVQAYRGLALVRLASDDQEGAVRTLQKAVSVDPEYSDGLVLLGTTLNHLQRYDSAVTALKKAVEVDAKKAEAHFRLAEAYFGTGQSRQAVQAARAALRQRKDFYAAMVVLADAHADLGEIDSARRWYGEASKDSRQRDYCNHKLQELDALEEETEGR